MHLYFIGELTGSDFLMTMSNRFGVKPRVGLHLKHESYSYGEIEADILLF